MVRKRTGPRLGTQCWAKLQCRHHNERRNKPSSHAHLAGCGGDTEWDIPEEGCDKLMRKKSDGVNASCLLKLVEGVALQPRCCTT